jgi:small subunit ribosomal protein S7
VEGVAGATNKELRGSDVRETVSGPGERESEASIPRFISGEAQADSQKEAQSLPRKGKIRRKKIQPDYVYNSSIVAKFINMVMLRGKKKVAEQIVYRALQTAGKKLNLSPMEAFNKAVSNVKPVLEVKARRVGGATYQVPVEVRGERAVDLAMRWIIQFARLRKGKSMSEKLAEEIVAAANSEGLALKKKEDLHKMAEANRAFAHYRW